MEIYAHDAEGDRFEELLRIREEAILEQVEELEDNLREGNGETILRYNDDSEGYEEAIIPRSFDDLRDKNGNFVRSKVSSYIGEEYDGLVRAIFREMERHRDAAEEGMKMAIKAEEKHRHQVEVNIALNNDLSRMRARISEMREERSKERGGTSHLGIFKEWPMVRRIDIDGDSCPVCLEEVEINDRLPTIPCGHVIHIECLMFIFNPSAPFLCPLCRSEIIPDTPTRSSAPIMDGGISDNSDGETEDVE